MQVVWYCCSHGYFASLSLRKYQERGRSSEHDVHNPNVQRFQTGGKVCGQPCVACGGELHRMTTVELAITGQILANGEEVQVIQPIQMGSIRDSRELLCDSYLAGRELVQICCDLHRRSLFWRVEFASGIENGFAPGREFVIVPTQLDSMPPVLHLMSPHSRRSSHSQNNTDRSSLRASTRTRSHV